jgi:TPR repeat protein
VTVSGARTQQSAPAASDQKPETFTTSQLSGTAQCSSPQAFDQKSVAAFEQQAANGNAAAQCGLGIMYALGHGVPQDYT